MRRTIQAHGNQARDSRLKSKAATLAILILFAAAKATAQGREAQAAEGLAASAGGNSPRRIVVSIPDRELALVENGRLLKVYPVSVGAPESPSPTGEFKIVRRLSNPTYYAPGVVIPAGPPNPLGPRWIGLNLKGYGIHGTNQPGSIGHRASHGCIRLRNRDVEELFELVRPGDVVELHAERDAEVAKWFGGEQAPVVIASAGASWVTPAPAANAVAAR